MTLSASALITLDDARSYLSLLDSDVDDDPDLVGMIEAASRQIMLFAGRLFAPAVDDEERVFDYDGGGSYLSLADNDLRAATLVTLTYTGRDPITLDTTRYSLRPRPARDGVYTYLKLHPHRHRWHSWWQADSDDVDAEIAITGDWGFETVPTDVQLACKMQVAVWQRGDRTAFTRSYNPEAGTVSGGDGLAGSVKALLYGGGYCRTAIG